MTVTFVVPVHGRESLTRVCLRQLRRTCNEASVRATAVVVGEGPILEYARIDLGFATVKRDNSQLGRKFNDGFQLACDPDFNPWPADYVVPCGSDDWIDPAILERLPPAGQIGVFRQMAVVSEDRTRLARITVGWKGGAGIRIIPRSMIAAAGYRPSAEERARGCDTATLEGIKRATGRFPAMVELDRHPLQIVDFKTDGVQLNSYRSMVGFRRNQSVTADVWDELRAVFPEAVDDMIEASA